jgi:hypothetical protein
MARRVRSGIIIGIVGLGVVWLAGGAVWAEDEAMRSILEKLRATPHPEVAAGDYDIFDYPQKPTGRLVLMDARKPGEKVDVTAFCAGKVAVLAEICTQGTYAMWSDRQGEPEAVRAYRELYEKYASRGVEFILVWGQAVSGSKGKERTRTLADAVAYAEKHRLPGRCLWTASRRTATGAKNKKAISMPTSALKFRGMEHPVSSACSDRMGAWSTGGWSVVRAYPITRRRTCWIDCWTRTTTKPYAESSSPKRAGPCRR